MTIGRVVRRGTQAALGLAVFALGLTWLNRVAAAVMAAGGSCGTGGPYELATPCPEGAWMAPVGIFVGMAGLALYLWWRPRGGPQWVFLGWPALFGSLGIQFLRAAADERSAYGFWFCGVLFLVMAAAPILIVLGGDRSALTRALLGDGRAEPDEREDPRVLERV